MFLSNFPTVIVYMNFHHLMNYPHPIDGDSNTNNDNHKINNNNNNDDDIVGDDGIKGRNVEY